MSCWRAGLWLAALVAGLASPGQTQDSTGLRTPLPLDTARWAPLYRVYDMIVHRGDSATVIGYRTVAMLPGSFAGTGAWRIVEQRTGAVPATDSLWLKSDGKPLYWSSALGPGRLTAQFANDTLFGMVALGRVNQNLVLPLPDDLLVTTAMTDVILGALPLHATWADSAALLEVEPSGARTVPAELIVVAEEAVDVPGDASIRAWVLAIRTPGRQLLYWVDQQTGIPVRIQQNLPSHIGSFIEYRIRFITVRLPALLH